MDQTNNQQNPIELLDSFLKNIFEKMQINCTLSSTIADDLTISVQIEGDTAILTKRRGEMLNSLQYLCLVLLYKNSLSDYKVFLDCDNFREKRISTLSKLAKKIAKEVAFSGKKQSLEPMNATDRRIIHIALQDDEFVKTESEGEEPFRYVVVIPKKETPQSSIDFKRNGFGRKKSFGKPKRSLR